jgi:hypothetical protein
VQFTVMRGGAPAPASVSYQFLLAGQVVARRSTYHFHGHFSDTLEFPAAAVGYPLTVRAVVTSGPTTVYLDAPVRVMP